MLLYASGVIAILAGYVFMMVIGLGSDTRTNEGHHSVWMRRGLLRNPRELGIDPDLFGPDDLVHV